MCKMRTCIVFIIAFIIITGLVGCVGQTNKEETEKSTVNPSEAAVKEETKPLKISWGGLFGTNAATIADKNMVQKHLEEKFNVEITNGVYDLFNNDQMNLLISSGEMPDMAFLYQNENLLLKQGVIRSIPLNMIRENAPGYAKMMDQDPLLMKLSKNTFKKDEYWSLYASNSAIDTPMSIGIMRLDWLEKAGITFKGEQVVLDNFKDEKYNGRAVLLKEPITLEELENVFAAWRNSDPAKKTYPLSAFDMEGSFAQVAAAFGVASWKNIEENGKALPWYITSKYKDMLKLLNHWYKEGYIDPEWLTLNWDTFNQKVDAGLVGFVSSNYLHFDDSASYVHTRPPVSTWNKDPNARFLVLGGGITGPGGTYICGQRYNVGSYGYQYFVNRNVDDEKLARILQIYNYVNFDDEGYWLARYGKEGEHFKWAGEPKKSFPVRNEELIDVNNQAKLGFGYYNNSYTRVGWESELESPIMKKLSEFFFEKKSLDRMVRNYKFDLAGQTKINDIVVGPAAEETRKRFFTQAVIGEVDIDTEWDKYLQALNAVPGFKEMLEELDKAPLVSDLLK